MKKDDSVYCKHILNSISKIEEYTSGFSGTQFNGNTLVQDAVARQIEIIGEASKQISPDLKKKHAGVPWKNIAGMRDKLIHDYLGVDIEAVWATVETDLPALKLQIKQVLATIS